MKSSTRHAAISLVFTCLLIVVFSAALAAPACKVSQLQSAHAVVLPAQNQ